MPEEAVTDQPTIENELLKNVFEQLTEEKWTRTAIDNYSKGNFILLDDIIKSAEKENVAEDLRLLCIDHLNQSPKSIIALYIAGIITYEQEIIDDSYILQIINLFKENKKWQVLEYLAEKVLTYGENKFALMTLEDCYTHTENTEELLKTWERLAKVDYENGEIPKKLAIHYEKDGNNEESIFYYKMALKRYAKSQSFKIVEDIWTHLAELIPHELDFFFHIKDEVVKYESEKVAALLSLLLTHYQDKNDYDMVIRILKMILECNPKDKSARDQLVEALQSKYSYHSQLEEYIDKSGLTQSSREVKQALESFEKYIVFDRGNFVFHRSWGIGKIVDCKESSFVIDFETKKNHTMSLKIALTSLKTLSEDHIWIQKKRDPDSLKQDDPEGIKNALISIFKSYNNKATMKEIKKEMTELIPLTSWTKWWNKAKQVMKTSSIFGNSPAKRDLYFLRDKPLTFEEETITNFFGSSQFDSKLSSITDYLKHSSDIDSDGFQQMLNFFVEIANHKSMVDEKTIKSFLLLRKIKRENPKVVFELKLNPYELLSAEEDLINAYSTLTDNEFRRDILDIVKKNDPEWESTFLTIFKESKATKAHNFIVDELVIHDKIDELKDGFTYLIDRYRQSSENYFWVAKTLMTAPDLIDQFGFEKKRLTFNLFHCLDIINKEINTKKTGTQKANRKLFPQIVDFLLKENPFNDYVDVMVETDARKILALVNSMNVLDEKTRSQFTIKLFDKFPSLMKEEVEVTKELHTFLVTKESYGRKQRELQNIISVEIPNNSKAIGIAQELGDLRENADYIAALEHQKQLQQMASTLNDELNKIKILLPDEVDASTISPGTTIELCNLENNQPEYYTILGEWESNMEKGIISYKSPFGRSLLGAKKKDKVVYDHGGVQKEYEVKKIEKAEELLA